MCCRTERADMSWQCVIKTRPNNLARMSCMNVVAYGYMLTLTLSKADMVLKMILWKNISLIKSNTFPLNACHYCLLSGHRTNCCDTRQNWTCG